MGYQWVDLNPVHTPPIRFFGAIDYNPNTQRVVLFGGNTNGGFGGPGALNDIWYWDGTDWTQAFPSGGPPLARSWHKFVYDPIHDEFLTFGGSSNAATYLSDTWTLSGDLTTWTQKTPSVVPVGRYGYAMSYHPATSSIYMMGGNNPNFFPNDRYETYRWTGSDWVLLSPANAPNSVFQFYLPFGTPVGLEPNSGKLVWINQHWKFSPVTEFPVQMFFDGINYTAINSFSAIMFGAFAFGSFQSLAVHNNLGRLLVAGGNGGSNYVPAQGLNAYPSTSWDRYDQSVTNSDPLSLTQMPLIAPDKDGNVLAYSTNILSSVKTYSFRLVQSAGQIYRRS